MRVVSRWVAILTPTIINAYSQIPITQDPLVPTASDDFQVYTSHRSSDHSIRIKQQNATICNTTVEQYTGWLDVGPAHLFFWYFKAENPVSTRSPSASSSTSEPLTLWLTGGPGGSSMLGMLQELGPCLINEHGNGTVYNPYGWNKNTALIFIDQPVGVGFSYLDEGEPLPGDSFTTAADVHLFLQMFVSQVFPEHKDGPVILTGESYAGHYLPALGSQIVSQNLLHPRQPKVNLKSLAIGNGYVSPLDTAFGYWETLCTTNPGVDKPVFNETRCELMATNLPRCLEVAKTCYDHPDPAICAAASTVCWKGVIGYYDGESYAGGRNRFDITAPCEIDDFCYKNTVLIQEYLNLPSSFAALAVPPAVKGFNVSSDAIASAFEATDDLEISLIPQVQYLLSQQIDILIYQGNLDLACNTAGAKRWTADMAWKGQAEFVSKELKPWSLAGDGQRGQGEEVSQGEGEEKKKKQVVGTWKEVNVKMGAEGDDKTTRFALVTIDGSGHMVPQDQPEVALVMLNRWLAGESFGE